MAEGKGSDLKIECQDRTFHVHKAIVCKASPALKAAITDGFEETASSIIKHCEYDADTVKRLIQFIYTKDYDVSLEDVDDTPHFTAGQEDTPDDEEVSLNLELYVESDDETNSEEGDSTTTHEDSLEEEDPETQSRPNDPIKVNDVLIAHARVFGLADYYDIPFLRLLATQKFSEAASKDWDINGFSEVIKEVYRSSASTDHQLRSALKDIGTSHVFELGGNEHFMADLTEGEDSEAFVAEMFRALGTMLSERKTVTKLLSDSFGALLKRYCNDMKQLREEHLESVLELGANTMKLALDRANLERDVAQREQAADELADDLNRLPGRCNNEGCRKALRGVSLDVASEWPEKKWWIRCKKCNGRQNG